MRVSVADSGIGLTPEEQSQIFTRFYRAQNATTKAVGGTGLGLSITRTLVEMNGGKIDVSSAVGEGSVFSFTLPIADTESDAVHSHSLTRGSATGCVLVVDDEPDIAALIRRYLERAGYRVIVASDATQAVTLARAERPDLITLDVMLPGTDGFTLLEWLKADPATTAIPVVMLSVMDDVGHGELLGAVGYVRKPVNEHDLLEHVRVILADVRTPSILLADGDDEMRTLLSASLRRGGYRVMEAANGREALALASDGTMGLALLDIRMLEMNGIETLRALRANDVTRNLPVIMMTAGPDLPETSRSTIAALGGMLLPYAPCSAEELVAAISRELTELSRRRIGQASEIEQVVGTVSDTGTQVSG